MGRLTWLLQFGLEEVDDEAGIGVALVVALRMGAALG